MIVHRKKSGALTWLIIYDWNIHTNIKNKVKLLLVDVLNSKFPKIISRF